MDADLNLITTPDLFLTKEQLPENYQIVGPIFAKLGSSLPDEVLTLFNKSGGKENESFILRWAVRESAHGAKNSSFLAKPFELAIIAPVTSTQGNTTTQRICS